MASKTSPLLYSAETWERVYQAFDQINFTAYDYDAVKQSLLDYLKLNYPENFNDYHESSLMIALIEVFAYAAEQLAYRVDMSVHEALLPTAQRKQSILALAKLISYTASRNLPLRGLVKLNSVSVSESVTDSQGNNLGNRVVRWNDPNNTLWKEQFLTIINRVLTQPFGSPLKSFQLDDTIFQQYEVQNVLETEADGSTFRNGVLKFKQPVNGDDMSFELVPADIDGDGVFERSPNPNAYFSLLYGDDGYGDGSDTTGFMFYLKQGELAKLVYTFDSPLPNRVLNVDVSDINDVDVWVQSVNELGVIKDQWTVVPNINGQNLMFNGVQSHKKYEIETLEGDRVRLIFGDGDFAEIPTGTFNIWVRSSTSGQVQVPKNKIANRSVTFLYTSKTGQQESCTFTYSLTSALQNSAESEDIEHIRAVAPSVYYSQNRMVNGEDYNSFFLRDSSILRLRSINRTFSGQPKYLDWNDASGQYQNVKVFGNDARLYYNFNSNASIINTSGRSMVDEILEPALSDPGVYSLIPYAFYHADFPLDRAYVKPRTRFVEDQTQHLNGVPIQEKTWLQGAIDRHWYGEPDRIVRLDINLEPGSALPSYPHAVVNGDTDHRIYDSNLRLVTYDELTQTYSAVNTPGNVSGIQESVMRQRRFGIKFNPNRAFQSRLLMWSANMDPADDIPVVDSVTHLDIVQSKAQDDVYTVEITDDQAGTFTVYSRQLGPRASGAINEPYSDGVISFLIGFPPNVSQALYEGDAFIVTITSGSDFKWKPTVYKRNLQGTFQVVDDLLLDPNAETQSYSLHDDSRNWIMILERFDDELTGEVSHWKLTKRNLGLTIESATTKFWYNEDQRLIDTDTKKPVRDEARILKSNLFPNAKTSIGVDYVYDVIGPILYPDGNVNMNALNLAPSKVFDDHYHGAATPVSPFSFLYFIGTTSYVYFKRDSTTGKLTPLPTTVYLQSLEYHDDVSGGYVRKRGRENLDFLWQHFTPDGHLIDPSTSNIVDVYVLTRGYYSSMMDYLRGLEPVEPSPPTPLELRNTYRSLIESKMISDTVVMHPGKVKLLFGRLAPAELRARFRIVRAAGAKLTGDQIRAGALDLINQYFSINNWDFGQDFYATELLAVLQTRMPVEIASVVLVPIFPSNYFGDLFHLRSSPDEILVSCATLDDIEIVDGLDKLTLKQR